MAELRSFIIGVTIAGLFLLVGGLAFGLFGDDTSGSPSVRLLGTPPATRTPPPATTRDPSELTPVPPSATSETATTGTQAPGNTPSAIQTATPTLEVAPTADVEPTEAPPVVDPVDDYIAAANQYAPALLAQIEYLLGNASAPNITATDWRTFTLESAQNIQALAGALAGIAAPGCVSGAHGSLVAAANEASAAAGQVAAGVNANDAAAVGAATGPLGAAQSLVGGAVTEVSNTLGSAC